MTTAASTVLQIDDVTKTYPSQPPVVALCEVSSPSRKASSWRSSARPGQARPPAARAGHPGPADLRRVLITGLDMAHLSDRQLATLRATRIGFVFQQFFLAEHAT